MFWRVNLVQRWELKAGAVATKDGEGIDTCITWEIFIVIKGFEDFFSIYWNP